MRMWDFEMTMKGRSLTRPSDKVVISTLINEMNSRSPRFSESEKRLW